MSDSITFTTEAERLKAREQYVAIACTVNDARGREAEGRAFDFAFPPIAPSKMVPWEGWAFINRAGDFIELWRSESKPLCSPYQHIVRVRVVEVDGE